PPTSTLLPYTTLFRSNAGTQYTVKLQHGMQAFARAEVFGVGRYAYDSSNAAQSSAYILSNFRIGVSGEHWRIQGFIDNAFNTHRSEEHTSELQSLAYL